MGTDDTTDNFRDVGDFHEKFGLHRSDKQPGIQQIDHELLEFRTKFMQEELDEFIEAVEAGDHAKAFDALLDLTYVVMGTAHLAGYPWQAGWQLVQQANMAKVRAKPDGSDSKRGSSWDVVKPEGWTPPDIEGLLELFMPRRAQSWPPEGPRCTLCNRLLSQPGVKCRLPQGDKAGACYADSPFPQYYRPDGTANAHV
jgi:predicted HAD superfamily Cof-like phosphohydrolase